MEAGLGHLATISGVALALAGCTSTATNPDSKSTGGSAGISSGGGGGTSGDGGAGGGTGGVVSNPEPKLVEHYTLSVSGSQFAADVDVSPLTGNPLVLGYGSFASAQKNFLVELDLGAGVEVSRREFTTPDQAYMFGVNAASDGTLQFSGMYRTSFTVGGQTVNDAAGWGAVSARITPGNPDQVVAYTYAGPGDQTLHDNAPFGKGIVSAGTLQGSVNVHGTQLAADTAGDALVSVEFDPSNRFSFFQGAGRQAFNGVATTPTSDVIAVGESPQMGDLSVLGTGSGGQLAIVVSYDSTLTTPSWTAAMGSAGDDNFNAVAVNPKTGDIVATGWVKGPVDTGQSTLDYVAGEDVLVACFQKNGTLRWAKTFGGGADDRGYGVAITPSGDVFVAGSTKSASADLGMGALKKQGNEDGFVVRYDADGNVKWGTLIGGTGTDSWGPIRATSEGRLFLAGRFQGSFTFLGTQVSGNADAGAEWDIALLVLET